MAFLQSFVELFIFLTKLVKSLVSFELLKYLYRTEITFISKIYFFEGTIYTTSKAYFYKDYNFGFIENFTESDTGNTLSFKMQVKHFY